MAERLEVKLGEDGIDTNIQDFKSLMFRIKGENPDLIYFGGTTLLIEGDRVNLPRILGEAP